MAQDIAIDYNTGDLVLAPSTGLAVRTGPDTVAQRIRVRLRIIQGAWILDPTNGTLGSRIQEVLRLPSFRAVGELELVIREALEPMTDISIDAVDVQLDPDSQAVIGAAISYSIDDDEGVPGDIQTISIDFGGA